MASSKSQSNIVTTGVFVFVVVIFIVVVVASISGVAAASSSDEREILMARCRATCARRHLDYDAGFVDEQRQIKEVSSGNNDAAADEFADNSPDGRCRRKADCQMCWKTCAMIFGNVNIWGSMCNMPKAFCVSLLC